MRCSLAGLLLLPMALAISVLCAQTQPDAKDPKQDKGKPAAGEKKPVETKIPPKDGKPEAAPKPGEPKPVRPTLDKLKIDPGTIIVIMEKLKDAVEQFPQMILISPEEYQELKNRLRVLEQQLKGDKTTTHSCKLTGKLEGDYVALRAEFTFATQQPKTQVVLGLQGTHLVDEGDLDKTAPQLDYGDDGWVIRVDKEGPHQLTLNLKAPVGVKRGAGLGGATERGLDLGLPGAPATTLNLELPAGIKDLRVNDTLKKSKTPGRWELPLGLAKQVGLAWKDPLVLSGGGPLLTMETQVVVKLDQQAAQVQAEVFLEDRRGKTEEWRLLLPPGAKATVKQLPADAFQWSYPDPKNPWHILQLKQPTTERIAVTVQASLPRTAGRLALGPFAAAGAIEQQGTVLIQASADALRGQRLVYHPRGDVRQRDLPKKSPAGVENLAYFEYTAAAPAGAVSKAPLELEFKAHSGLAETQVDHVVRLKGAGENWYVETTSRIQAKSLAQATDYLDVALPRARALGAEALGVAPCQTFPAALPWAMALPTEGRWVTAAPLEFRREEEGVDLAMPDGSRRVRLNWSQQNGKQLTLTIHGKYAVPAGVQRVRVDLPRPQGSLDRGGTLAVHCGPLVELLTGTPGAEETVPERQHWQRPVELAPAIVDLSWRPYQPVFAVAALVDATLHQRSVHVRQQLSFMAPSGKGPGIAGAVALRVPQTIRQVNLEGGKLLGEPRPDTGLAWLTPQVDAFGKCTILLDYDVALPKLDDAAAANPEARAWDLPLLWPDAATRKDAKVRIWSEPGAWPALSADAIDWHERGIESVERRDSLPALVVQGAGASVPLTVQVRPIGPAALAALVSDRTLIQVRIDDDGNQFYKVRSAIRKLVARQLTLELPVAVRDKDTGLTVRLGPEKLEKTLAYDTPVWNIAVIAMPAELPAAPGQPIILDIEYKLPASATDGKRLGQTLLHPPRWHGDVLPGTVRWQVDWPADQDQIALITGSGAHLDYRWALHGWLLAAEAGVTAGELEAWLSGREPVETAPVSLTYWRSNWGTQRLVHLPRQLWLLVCSALALMVGLIVYLLPLPRLLLRLIVLSIGLGILAGAYFWPALAPPLFYGCEPGLGVLVVLCGMHWLLQERYRRQVVFMPGFARLQTGSSLARTGPAPKTREPSTVDAPESPRGGANHSVSLLP